MNTSTARKEQRVPANICDEAFRLANIHQVSPTPKAYETWYTYVAGKNVELNDFLNPIVNSGEVISDYDLKNIHDKYVSPSNPDSIHQGAANYNFSREMDDILNVIQTYLTSSEYFSGTLDKNFDALSDDPSPKQVLQTIKNLIVENSVMRDNSANLMKNLNTSKRQLLEMQSSLKKSKQNEMKDALTNMYNRRYFDMLLADSISDAAESDTPMCLVMVDIDNFKKLNDRYGHLIGDEVLKFVATLLMKNVKGQDIPVRYGGEEFAIILPDTKIANAMTLMERIRILLESAKLVLTKRQQSIGKVTASFGIAQIHSSEEPDELIQRADAKLYQAKDAGRNCIAC
ncbi:MAG: GGDEF domain-containing protein [Hyphomicrobiales bacterium]|nr:GGDEF domain-containing protein [Hyphomicrobiales bacterium]